MKIKLKSLELLNFKGISKMKIDFDKKLTSIHGDNGTGKTTIFDAFTFLMYGKNSADKKVFDIKTFDSNGKVINKLSHEVTGVLEVDGSEIKLQVVYKEKWTKKKGAEESELTGHSMDYFVNDVPCTLSEYKTKIDSICDEDSFKILCNPLFFNEQLSWDKRRVVLSRMAGSISNDEIIKSLDSKDSENIAELFLQEKTLDEFKKEFSAKRKKLKEELDSLPARIDEAIRSIPSEQINFEDLENKKQFLNSQIENKEKNISDIQSSINEKNKEALNNINEIQSNKQKLVLKLSELQSNRQNKSKSDKIKLEGFKSNVSHDIYMTSNKVKNLESQLSEEKRLISEKETKKDALLKEFEALKKKEFILDLESMKCPTCNTPFSDNKVEELKKKSTDDFCASILKEKEEIKSKGFALKSEIEAHNKNVSDIISQVESFKKFIADKQKELKEIEIQLNSINENKEDEKPSDEEVELKKQIDSIIIPEIEKVDVSELTKEFTSFISEAKKELEEINQSLYKREVIENQNKRVEELKEKQKATSQEMANIEKIEFSIDRFNNKKVDLIEKRINEKFKFVKFKMFEEQINGGLKEICDATVNGVPYSSLNTAMKINAGIDICNVLSDFYKINAPMFIDNKESVVKLTETESQLICLVVDENEKSLKVK